MSDVAQDIEDILEEISSIHKAVNKLTTVSVSGGPLRRRMKDLHKKWLPLSGILEKGNLVLAEDLETVNGAWSRLGKLADGAHPKAQYKPVLRSIVSTTEKSLLHSYIKNSGIQTSGDVLRRLVQGVSDASLLKYVDESIRCAEANCVRGSVVLAWCAVAFKVHQKLVSLGMPQLEGHFDKMRLDQGLMFKSFNRVYKFSSQFDIQEIPDAHLILLCRFLTYLDDTQYKHLKAALDLRNGCGHPTGYQPDPVKLQAYYADITQLVLSNPNFT